MKSTEIPGRNPDREREQKTAGLLRNFRERFGISDPGVFAAPGRTEIGGNHTDHQNGMVLAAAVDRETLAAAAVRPDGRITVFSVSFRFWS